MLSQWFGSRFAWVDAVATHQLGVEFGEPRLTLAIEDQKCVNHGGGTSLIIAQRPVGEMVMEESAWWGRYR
jgi:hypothetical protein